MEEAMAVRGARPEGVLSICEENWIRHERPCDRDRKIGCGLQLDTRAHSRPGQHKCTHGTPDVDARWLSSNDANAQLVELNEVTDPMDDKMRGNILPSFITTRTGGQR